MKRVSGMKTDRKGRERLARLVEGERGGRNGSWCLYVSVGEVSARRNRLRGVTLGPTLASAYIGDGARFDMCREAANYVGLTPELDCSGDTVRYQHIQ